MLDNYTCVVTGHSPAVPFNVLDGDLARLAQPTVQDLLEYAAERHHVDCGCEIKIGGRAWFTSVPLAQADDCEWAIVAHNPLPLNTSLCDLPAVAESTVQLVIAGEQSSSMDYLRRYREKLFMPYCVEDATAYKRFGASSAVLPEEDTSFASVCSTPGSVFVDKSRFLLAMFQFSLSEVNVIRRPKGFGTTTFLSMFDAFFDPLSAHANFPFTFTEDMSMPVLKQHSQLLVFALDFADLSFDEYMGYEALRAECNRLLDDAAQKFYNRYRKLLGVSEAEISRPGVSPSFFYILRWAQLSEWKLCLTIDNYTAPFVDKPDPVYGDAINRHIFATLSALLDSRFMMYGLIVGDDIPHCSDWLDLSDIAVDVSNSPVYFEAIGFTFAEVSALGQATSLDLTSALQACTLIPARADTTMVYASADILSLVRQALNPDGLHHTPLEVRTFCPSDVLNQREEQDVMGAQDIEMYHASPCRRYYQHEEEEAESDVRTPGMTADTSSSGSSSSSASTSSSASSSASRKKQPQVAIAEEPSSPLEAYGKKP